MATQAKQEIQVASRVIFQTKKKSILDAIDFATPDMGDLWLTRIQIGLCDHLWVNRVKLDWLKVGELILPFWIGPSTNLSLEFDLNNYVTPGHPFNVTNQHNLILRFTEYDEPV